MVVRDAAKEYRKAQKQAIQGATATETTESMGDIGKWLRNGGNAPKKRRTGSTGSKGSSMEGVGRTLERSRRAKKTSPGYSKARYKRATKKVSEITGATGKVRKIIADPEEVRRMAQARSSRTVQAKLMDIRESLTIEQYQQASNTLMAIISMCRKYCTDRSILHKIEQMDSEKLFRLLESNSLIIEIVFQYLLPPELMYDGTKNKDFQFLIDEYEGAWGTINIGEIGYGDF